jgi:hypothetical protein
VRTSSRRASPRSDAGHARSSIVLDQDLHSKIFALASRNGISFNHQCILLLEGMFGGDGYRTREARSANYSEAATIRTSLRLEKPLFEKIRAIAAKEGRTLTGLVSSLLDAATRQNARTKARPA